MTRRPHRPGDHATARGQRGISRAVQLSVRRHLPRRPAATCCWKRASSRDLIDACAPSTQGRSDFEDSGDRRHGHDSATARRSTAAALIGADGLWSNVRERDRRRRQAARLGSHRLSRACCPSARWRRNTGRIRSCSGPGRRRISSTIRCDAASCSTSSRSSTATATRRAGTSSATPTSSTPRFKDAHPTVKHPARQDQRSGRCGCCATASRSGSWTHGRVDAARRRRASDAAIPRARRRHGDRGCRRARATRSRAAGDDYASAFQRLQSGARYLRTARVQLYARLYGEFYHAERRAGRSAQRAAEAEARQEAGEGMAWLYDGITA